MPTCNRCKVEKNDDQFLSIRGKVTKRCQRCRDMNNANQIKNKCPHGKRSHRCVSCDGVGICIHRKDKSICIPCGGSAICIHLKERINCKICKGSAICEHNVQRASCVKCLGSSICQHFKRKRFCRKCKGIEGAINIMINSSRRSDKDRNRYDPDHFIDKCFLEGLFEDNPDLICPYCQETMNLEDFNPKLVTIERKDNSIGHIKSNCILACFDCNVKCVGQRDLQNNEGEEIE